MFKKFKSCVGFWNDEDGITVTDFISIFLVVSYIVMIFSTILYLEFSKMISIEALSSMRDVLELLNYPICIILTGYFGSGITNKIVKNTQKN